uniref:Transmembrane protein n=1 Tax=Opuntia streptacantha TaxID=393608 RepID=A0A7C9B2C7_OPUST
MHRSHSSTRVADEYYRNLSSAISSSSAPSGGGGEGDGDGQLPVYSPVSDVAKKEKSRLRSAENAVHLIPLVLVLCAVILWFFSNPALKVAGSMEIDGTHNSLPHLEHPELEDVIFSHQHHQHQHIRPAV